MLTNLFPIQLSALVLNTFSSISCSPVLLKLVPAFSEIQPETMQEEPYRFLHSNELTQLNRYRLAKRRSEYLTGRICAKMAILEYLQFTFHKPPSMYQMDINSTEYGRPVIRLHPAASFPVPDISISHSKGYGAAIASQYRCGIDIQRQEESLIKVREKYCLEQEYPLLRKIMPTEGELLSLSLLWSAKEAIQKTFSTADSMPAFSDICLQDGEKKDDNNTLLFFSLPSRKNRQKPEIITVAAGVFLNYAIAVSALQENG